MEIIQSTRLSTISILYSYLESQSVRSLYNTSLSRMTRVILWLESYPPSLLLLARALSELLLSYSYLSYSSCWAAPIPQSHWVIITLSDLKALLRLLSLELTETFFDLNTLLGHPGREWKDDIEDKKTKLKFCRKTSHNLNPQKTNHPPKNEPMITKKHSKKTQREPR